MSIFRIKALLGTSYDDHIQGENRKFSGALEQELTPLVDRLFGLQRYTPRKATPGSYEWIHEEYGSLSLQYKTGVLHSDGADFPACLKLDGHPVWLLQLENHPGLCPEVEVWVKPWVEVRFVEDGFLMRLQYVDGVPGEWVHVLRKIDVVDNGTVIGMVKEMEPVQERRNAILKEIQDLVLEMKELDRFDAAYPPVRKNPVRSESLLSDLFRNTQAL